MGSFVCRSPLATTARTLTDPRKYEGDLSGGAVALNLLTVTRISDVSPAARDAAVRDAATKIAPRQAERTYENTRFSKADIERVAKQDSEQAAQMRAFNELMNLMAKTTRSTRRCR